MSRRLTGILMAKHRLSVWGRVVRDDHAAWNGWVTWVNDPGTNNLQDTFEGGEPASIPLAVVDLSSAASIMLGRQVSQSATYKLRGVTIGYRAHDDTTVTAENESDAAFQGNLRWFANTDHFKEANSLARRIEEANESLVVDLDSFLLSNEKDYSGFRMDWFTGSQGVKFPTAESVAGITGGTYSLLEIATAYNNMTAPSETNALFNGRFPGIQELGWNATVSSGYGGNVEGFHDFQSNPLMHEIGRGLMALEVTHSTIASHQGLVEDDYQWYVGFDFEVTV